MAQPPDDRRPLPWEAPREPDAPTPPPEEPPAPPPDEAPTVVTPTPGADAAADEGIPPASPTAPPTAPPPPEEPSAAPVSPLISWTPSGAGAAGAAAGSDPAWTAAGVGTAGAAGSAGAAPVVGWEAPVDPTPPAGAVGYTTAGVGARLIAYFFDSFIETVVVLALLIVVILVVPSIGEDVATLNLLGAILSVGVSFLYFVGFWTSSSGATLGMRLLGLRIVSSPGGLPLSITPAVIRWAAFGYPLAILAALPALTGISTLSSLALTVWLIVLLVTTGSSPTRQGIHDRWANSAVIRRIGASDTPAVVGCVLIIAIIIGLFIILPILFFSSLDPVLIEEILSEVGASI